MDEKEKLNELRRLKRQLNKADNKEEQARILARMPAHIINYRQVKNIVAGSMKNGIEIPETVTDKLSELATSFSECTYAFSRAAGNGNIGAAMMAVGKISHMYEAEDCSLTERQKKIYYQMCAWADSLSGKMPNA